MSRPSPMLGRAALLGLLLTLAGCADFGDAEPGVVNECTSDDACAASAQCDDDEGLCVAETSEPLEIAIEVIPPADLSGLPMPSWTTAPETLEGPLERDLQQPPHVDIVGQLRWRGERVPAEILFTRETLDGRPDARVRVSTLPEVQTIAEMEADFVARLGPGRSYQVEVRPSSEAMPGTDTPWLRQLPPLRVAQVETPSVTTAEDGATSFVWPVELSYPEDLTPECGGERFAGCTLSGSVVDLVECDEVPEAGLQVRAVEVETGLTVSSTGLTDEEGRFSIVTSPNAGRYVLRVGGGEDGLSPTISVDPAFLFGGELRIRVPRTERVVYQGRVESADGRGIGATLTFTANDVIEDSGLGGSFSATVESRSEGSDIGAFEVTLLAGTYEVVITPAEPGLAVIAEELRLTPTASGEPVRGQLFTLPERARFGGTVTTSGGERVPNVSVEAVALGVAEGDEVSPAAVYNRSSETVTDETGLFDLRLDLGRYDVFLKPPAESRYAWVVVPDRAVGSLDATFADVFELAAPVPVRGVVRSSGGAPLEGAEVRVYGRASAEERFVELGRARSDETGSYLLLVSPRL